MTLLDPWRPTAAEPFDLRRAGHLFRRAGFGSSLAARQRAVDDGVEATVDAALRPGTGEDADAFHDEIVAMDSIERLRAYRLWRMLAGDWPLRERMTYFWHGHFATSNQKVDSATLMARQMQLFDERGLERFDDLLLGVSRDPAMIRWLDNDTNVKGQPNENYAREIFELFALGRGNYTERDIREAARAFTGWHVRDQQFFFAQRVHDAGEKTVFGETGDFGGEEVVALTVRRPESARFIATKLLQFFVHPEPTEAEIEALAGCYTEQQRDVGATVGVLLRSRLFFSERALRSRIKDPIDLVIGAVRALGATASAAELASTASAMGQVLLEPPSVEGWHRERAWVTSATWLLRSNFTAELVSGRRYGLSTSADAVLGDATGPEARAERAAAVFADGWLSDTSRQSLIRFARSDAARGPGGASALLHAAATLPEGQLL